MRALLRLLCWRHARAHAGRALLGALAIALGVALYVALDVANQSVLSALQETARALVGKGLFTVTRAGGLGVEQAALQRVREVPGAIAAPVVEQMIALPELDESNVLALGVELSSDSALRLYEFEELGDAAPAELAALALAALRPDGIVLTRRLAERHGLAAGARLDVRAGAVQTTLVVGALLGDEGPARLLDGNFALLGLGTAQRLFGMQGRLDRIEVGSAGPSASELRARLEEALGSEFAVAPLRRRNPLVEQAVANIRSMSAMSAIALAVGFFLVYNSVSMAVLERARTIGILRAVGASRRGVVQALTLEWAAIGLVGSAAGVMLGWALARLLVSYTARTVNLFLISVELTGGGLSWPTAAIALVAGTATAAGAAFLPSLASVRAPPAELLRPSAARTRALARYRRLFALGALSLALTAAAVTWAEPWLSARALLVLSMLVFLALGLTAPQAMLWTARAARPLLRRSSGFLAWLAADGLSKEPHRTGVTVVAFGGAVGMLVASAALVRSFEVASERWMAEAFPFDLSINTTDLSQSLYDTSGFDASILDLARATPGVAAVYGVRSTVRPLRETEVLLVAIELEGFLAMHRERGSTGRAHAIEEAGALPAMLAGEAVVVSENLARLEGLRQGDVIELATAEGPRRVRVACTMEDYSWPTGAILIDHGVYRRWWKDEALSFGDVRVAPGASQEAVRAELEAQLAARGRFFVYDVPQLVDVARKSMAQSTALVNVQVLVAMAIGFLGIVNTLLISVLQRTREIGLLRAVGTTRGQVRAVIAGEALLLAFAGTALGVAAGLLAARGLLQPFAVKVTGFLVPIAVPWGTLGVALAAAPVLGLLASLLPARRAAALPACEALRYE